MTSKPTFHTLAQLLEFISSRDDNAPVNMFQGVHNDQPGCIIIQYGREHKLDSPSFIVLFDSINHEHRFDTEARDLLLWLGANGPQTGTTFGEIKALVTTYQKQTNEHETKPSPQ